MLLTRQPRAPRGRATGAVRLRAAEDSIGVDELSTGGEPQRAHPTGAGRGVFAVRDIDPAAATGGERRAAVREDGPDVVAARDGHVAAGELACAEPVRELDAVGVGGVERSVRPFAGLHGRERSARCVELARADSTRRRSDAEPQEPAPVDPCHRPRSYPDLGVPRRSLSHSNTSTADPVCDPSSKLLEQSMGRGQAGRSEVETKPRTVAPNRSSLMTAEQELESSLWCPESRRG